MLKEKVYDAYLVNNYNCGEAIVKIANDAYGLNIPEGSMKFISGFAGGVGCGSYCGALAGVIGMLGYMYIDEKEHETEGFRARCSEIQRRFISVLGSLECSELSKKYKTPETRCLYTIEKAAEILEEYLIADGKITAEKKDASISAEEIKRLKGLGFLHNKGTNNFSARVITRNGKITAAENARIAEAAAKFGNGELTMTTRLPVEIIGIPYENVEPLIAFLAEGGLETGGTGSKVRPVVSCKGTTCQYGLCDTYRLSEIIHQQFYKGYRQVSLPHKFKIAVGGCPNNCVKPDLNDLGIIGQRMPVINRDKCRGCNKCVIEDTCPIKVAKMKDGIIEIDESMCNHCGRCVNKCPFDAIEDGGYGYKIMVGGRWGKKWAHGRALNRIFTSEAEVLSAIEKTILFFREQGIPGERLSDTIERVGFDLAEAEILGDAILERKPEILGINITGGATC